MTRQRKNRSLFDIDDSDQQVLPFDFIEDDDEEQDSSVQHASMVEESSSNDSKDSSEVSVDDEQGSPSATLEGATNKPAKSAVAEPEDMHSEPLRAAGEKSESLKTPEPEVEKSIQPPVVSPSEQAIPPGPSANADPQEPAETSQVKTETKAIRTERKEAPKAKQPAVDKPAEIIRPGSTKEHGVVVTSSHKEINIGQVLQEARVRKNLSIDQVALSTKIKRDFIQALEEGDRSVLPARVFVDAYIKTLGDTYGISASELLKPTQGKSQGKMVPEEILNTLEKGKQVNVKEETKVNNIFKVAIVLIALFLLIALIVSRLPGKSDVSPEEPEGMPIVATPGQDTPPVQTGETPKKITSEDLEIFVAPQRSFSMTELPIPESKK